MKLARHQLRIGSKIHDFIQFLWMLLKFFPEKLCKFSLRKIFGKHNCRFGDFRFIHGGIVPLFRASAAGCNWVRIQLRTLRTPGRWSVCQQTPQ